MKGRIVHVDDNLFRILGPILSPLPCEPEEIHNLVVTSDRWQDHCWIKGDFIYSDDAGQLCRAMHYYEGEIQKEQYIKGRKWAAEFTNKGPI